MGKPESGRAPEGSPFNTTDPYAPASASADPMVAGDVNDDTPAESSSDPGETQVVVSGADVPTPVTDAAAAEGEGDTPDDDVAERPDLTEVGVARAANRKVRVITTRPANTHPEA